TAFTESFSLPAGAHHEALEYGKTAGWDSVAHMALVARLESEFDVMLDTDDVVGLSSFAKAREILTRYGAKFE
ncbi:MAG TPA: acyl carrier protein, partial [Bryobacteraceae bacterium]|nr:acyl carrier protein [Bryobacteraceae bacterium]